MPRSSRTRQRCAQSIYAVAIATVVLAAACNHAPTSPTSPTTPAASPGIAGVNPAASECAGSRAGWIWCDDFELDRLGAYFEYNGAQGSFTRAAGAGVGGSFGMRVRFAPGQVEAGSLHLAMGRVPSAYMRTVDAGTTIYRDVYWRMYVRTQPEWIGGGAYKLTRAMSLADANWAQAMAAHLWSDPPQPGMLTMDPARGTDAQGRLVTRMYNDFDRFSWLGALRGITPLFDAGYLGRWHCIEAHARLNDAAGANGVFEFWVNGSSEGRLTNLNWLGSYDAYGINAVFFENYWNNGSPAAQERYFDNIIISTQPIGCLPSAA